MEYEGLHMICFMCGKFGHRRDGCPFLKAHVENQGEQHQSQPAQTPLKPSEEAFGLWMIVQRRSRNPKKVLDMARRRGKVIPGVKILTDFQS